MIELNLLPEELKKKKQKIELPEIPFIPITIGVIAALLLLQLLLSGIIFASKKQLAALDRTWQEMAPEKKEVETIKGRISATSKKTRAIEELMQKRLNWSRLLNELSNSMIANIWLSGLIYDEKSAKSARDKEKSVPTLRLSGSASAKGEGATSDIARFIESLKSNKNFFRDFDEIELVSIKKGQASGQDVMDFTLVASFKSGRKVD